MSQSAFKKKIAQKGRLYFCSQQGKIQEKTKAVLLAFEVQQGFSIIDLPENRLELLQYVTPFFPPHPYLVSYILYSSRH